MTVTINGSGTGCFTDASGNVGIGTATPVSKLSVGGNTPSSGTIAGVASSGGTSLALSDNVTNSLYVRHLSGGATLCTDTGGALAFATNGNTERMRIDSSGNVGIGQTSITRAYANYNQLNISGSSGSTIQMQTSSTNNANIIADGNGLYLAGLSGYMVFATGGTGTGTERMRIDSSGNVGIGTSSPAYKLDVVTSVDTFSAVRSTGTIQSAILSMTGRQSSVDETWNIISSGSGLGSGSLRFTRGSWTGTPSMLIDSSGSLLVNGTSNPGAAKLYVTNTNDAVDFRATGSSGYPLALRTSYASSNGNLIYFGGSSSQVGSVTTNNTTTSFNTSSDYRLKYSVAPLCTGLAIVTALKPVTYKWAADDSDGEGFIAHELQAVIPLAVVGEKDAVNEDCSIKPQGVDYSKIVVHLVAAIQELSAKVAALEGKA